MGKIVILQDKSLQWSVEISLFSLYPVFVGISMGTIVILLVINYCPYRGIIVIQQEIKIPKVYFSCFVEILDNKRLFQVLVACGHSHPSFSIIIHLHV